MAVHHESVLADYALTKQGDNTNTKRFTHLYGISIESVELFLSMFCTQLDHRGFRLVVIVPSNMLQPKLNKHATIVPNAGRYSSGWGKLHQTDSVEVLFENQNARGEE